MTNTGILAPAFDGDPTFTVPLGHKHTDVLVWGNGNVECDVCEEHLGVVYDDYGMRDGDGALVAEGMVFGPWVNPAIGSYF